MQQNRRSALPFICHFLFAPMLWLMPLIAITPLSARADTPTVGFETNSASLQEQNLAPATLTVTRTASDEPLEVEYHVEAKTVFDIHKPFAPIDFPLDGKDFEPLSGKLTFKAGEHSAGIELKPLPNYHFKPFRRDRQIRITLLPGDGYSVGSSATATVVIQDDPSRKLLPSDELFFRKFDYTRPELQTVKAAVDRADFPAARRALASYFRERKVPARSYVAGRPREDIVRDALNDTYSVSGIKYHFPNGKIDWSGTDVKDPITGQPNPNWGWEFNRFAWWTALTDDYLKDPIGRRASGERIAYELKDWLATSPLELQSNGLAPGTRWRTLEVGGRLEGSWLRAVFLLKGTDLFSDDLLVDWVKAFYLHTRYLEVSAELSTNRGAGEARAVFFAGAYFPEFVEAKDWLRLGLKRQEDILQNDVFPDGAFNELSPGYHDLTIAAFEPTLALAKENGLSVSPAFSDAVMRLFDYMLYACEPNRLLPSLNDSQTIYRPLNDRLKDALKLFPERADYLWMTTDGAQGTPPPQTSHLFPDAGQAVMRSGWTRQDSYLLMDAGPYGAGHGNEDKLSINVDGYGVRHVMDCGPYDYVATSPFRMYSVSTLGKSAPVIDGLSQSRAGALELATKKSPVLWRSAPGYDYAAGTYGVNPLEGWGPGRKRLAETTRHVLYLKPDVWVVIDAFKALDREQHTYSGYFQCNDDNVEVDTPTRRVTIQLKTGEFDPTFRTTVAADGPSMTLTPVAPAGQTLQVLKGQEPPHVAGWKFEKSSAWKKQAIPSLHYDFQTSGDVTLAYVLAAAPAGGPPRGPSAAVIPTEPGTYGLSVTTDAGAAPITLLIALDRKTLTWNGKQVDAPCLIIKDNAILDWPRLDQ